MSHSLHMLSNQFDTKSNSTPFHMVCKEGQFDVVDLMFTNQYRVISIELNAQDMNGMTPFNMYGYLLV